MGEQYRFGGLIPESVKRLRGRREDCTALKPSASGRLEDGVTAAMVAAIQAPGPVIRVLEERYGSKVTASCEIRTPL